MPNSDPPTYHVDAVPQRRATITAALVGGMLGLLTCHASRLAVFVYARAVLPEQSDAGDRFGVDLVIWCVGGLILIFGPIIIALIGLLAGAITHKYRFAHPSLSIGLVVISLGLTGLIIVAVPLSLNLLVELGIMTLWVSLSAFGGNLAGGTSE